MTANEPRETLVWGLLAALAAVRLAIYGLSTGPLAYGHMSDEFYYLDCAAHLAWGYVDQPPLSLVAPIVTERGLRHLLGVQRERQGALGAVSDVEPHERTQRPEGTAGRQQRLEPRELQRPDS